MYCRKCGNEIKDGSSFCPVCGETMEQDTLDSAKPAKQPLHKLTKIGIVMLVIGFTGLLPIELGTLCYLIADALFIFAFLQKKDSLTEKRITANEILLTISVILTLLSFLPN